MQRDQVELGSLEERISCRVDEAAFNQNQVDQTWLICQRRPETINNFMAECSALEDKRSVIINELNRVMTSFTELPSDIEGRIEMVLDC